MPTDVELIKWESFFFSHKKLSMPIIFAKKLIYLKFNQNLPTRVAYLH